MANQEIAVIGAGVAGLVAAVTLAEAGLRVTVFEARDRAGGRILSETGAGCPVELGAEFLHGKHPALLRWVRRAGLAAEEMQGNAFRFSEGGLSQDYEDDRDDMFAALNILPAKESDDISFAAWASGLADRDAASALCGYVEGFNAANADWISCAALVKQQHAEEEIDGGTNFRLHGGYAPLIAWMQKRCVELGVTFRFRTAVDHLSWSRGQVTIHTHDGEHKFSRAVCAVPLSILQQGRLRIHPMPPVISQALSALVMGNASRLTIVFRRDFWDRELMARAEDMSFLFAQGSGLPVQVFWSTQPGPMLTGWLGGPRAERFAGGEALFAAMVDSLATCFSIPASVLRNGIESWHFHDWRSDPFALGAYSYVRTGGLPASRGFAEAIDNTLFFAGEHTDTEGHWGTVHAAIVTGERAARQGIASL